LTANREQDEDESLGSWSTGFLLTGLLTGLGQALVNEWKNTSTGDSSTDELVELLISSNGELQVARLNTFDAKILSCVT
jgi:hypothetical protein